MARDRRARCDRCGFAAGEWTGQDLTRTLLLTDELIGLWCGDVAEAAQRATDDLVAGARARIAEYDDPVEQVHALWHALVAVDDLRRAAGDAPAHHEGAVTQLSRSGGGVPKLPVDSVVVDHGGVEGDVQATRVHHGRPWQALCLWSADVIAELVAEGHPISAGAAGENVTVAGIDWASLRAGTILDIGTVRCQVSTPATPCRKNRRWFLGGDIDRMDHDRHPGSSRWYATVLRPGAIATGDPVVVEPPGA